MKKKMKLKAFTPVILGTCMLAFFAACGSDDDDNDSTTSTPPTEEEQPTSQDGQYRAVLTPVNANVAGTAAGTAEFIISGDEFRALVNVSGAPDGEHMQHVHIGTSCAGPQADTNGDGFIDIVEASAASGKALIPLDADLSSQLAGDTFPSGATYDYDQSTSFSILMADLRIPDTNPNDMLTKLGPNDDLNLAGKVVEVHGVPADTTLPATVQSMDGMSPQQTLPILCGVIERVDGGTTTGGTGTGTTTGGTGTTTGGTGTTTGGTGTTTGDMGTTTGGTGTGTTTGGTGATTGSGSENPTSF